MYYLFLFSRLSSVTLIHHPMKTSESFPYLLDGIFAELEAASRVVIDCQPVDETSKAIHENLRVTAVNGMGSAYQFLHCIKHLKAEAMEKLREALPHIIPADREAFIDLAMRRVRRINLAIAVVRLPGPPEQQSHTLQWADRWKQHSL
jgi:hypothetical protein